MTGERGPTAADGAESPGHGVPHDELGDRDLLAAHVAGDAEAFGVLFARHRDRLWAVALRTTGDPEEAADALQDALVAAFRRAGSFRGDSAVTTWLHRVVVNACLDRLRRRAVRMADPLPDDVDAHVRRSTGHLGARHAGPGGTGRERPAGDGVRPPTPVDPSEEAVSAERRAAVLAALGTLPAEQRAALVLVDMEGYSVEETAAILECAPGTVKSRCSRGRARLAPLLAGLLDPDARDGDPGRRNPSGSAHVPSPTGRPGRDAPAQPQAPPVGATAPAGPAAMPGPDQQTAASGTGGTDDDHDPDWR